MNQSERLVLQAVATDGGWTMASAVWWNITEPLSLPVVNQILSELTEQGLAQRDRTHPYWRATEAGKAALRAEADNR